MFYHSQTSPDSEEKTVVETKAAPVESTSPTVNIQTSDVDPVHIEVKETEFAHAPVLTEDFRNSSLQAYCIFPDTAPSVKQIQQCDAETQPVTSLRLSENVAECLPHSSALTAADENGNFNAEDSEEEEVLTNENDGFRFTITPAFIRDCNKPLLYEHKCNKEEESCLPEEVVLEEQFGGITNNEASEKRVQFSDVVQYFNAEAEGCHGETEEEIESNELNTGLDVSTFSASGKEKYHREQMDNLEEEGEADSRVEGQECDKEIHLETADVREDVMADAEVSKKDKPDEESAPEMPLTLQNPCEVTLQSPQCPPCNLTSTFRPDDTIWH